MNFWLLAIALALSYLVQVSLTTMQLRNFATTYAGLRRRGKVAIGKRKAALSAGSIALLRIDGDGIITEASAMSGLTVLARFKPLENFVGLNLGTLAEETLPRLPRGLRLAVLNARDNWLAVQRGETPQDPPGPLTRFLRRFRRSEGTTSQAHHARRVVHTQGVTS
jgi:glucitol operon activator protein